MSYILSDTRQKALDAGQRAWRTINAHPNTIAFRKNCIEAYGFYDGTAQWTADDLITLIERGQLPITVNIIQGFIDALSGVEIQSRYRVACRSDSGREDDTKLADALTHFLYNIQQRENIPHKGSLKFRDMLICGIGWSSFYREEGAYRCDYVHPFNVMPDPDDLSPQLTEMKHMGRKRWMRPEYIKKHWPRVAQHIDFSDPELCEGMLSAEGQDRNFDFTDVMTSTGLNQNRLLVCEIQRKIPHKAYTGIDASGHSFETFDLEKAEEIANTPRDIEQVESSRIMRTLFLGNYLLEHAPLEPNIPNSKDFSYIPCVWKRQFKKADTAGVPYGLLNSVQDIQRDCNARITKALYLINSSQVIFEGNAMPGKDIEAIRQELKKADSVIVLPQGSKFQMTSNASLGEEQLKVVQVYLDLMKRITGINDEMLGIQTNATSGVAQKIRQVNSVRNNVFAFDNFSTMKEREAWSLMAMIQSSFDPNIAVQILTEEETKTMILNLTREINGKPQVLNDVRTLPLSLYVEEVPDFRSSFEEQKAMFETLLGNAHAHWLMLSPELLRRLGVRDPERIAQEMRKALQEKAMMEGGGAGATQSRPGVQPQPSNEMMQGAMQ